jgi:type I restriction enzyme S subunit
MRKRYPKYKPTNIPWLKEAPEEWGEVKVKFLFRERVEKGYENEPLLAATQTQGVVPKELYENRTVTAQKDFHLLKLVEKGDFVISLRSFQGGIEYAHYRGIISPAYTIMRPGLLVEKGYFRHLFKSKYFIDDLATNVTGIREGQNIDYAEFRDSFQPLPPLPDQRQIAAFLDHKCGLIDTFIQKKTRLIELLKEQKQAIINKAVTKGIDPDVRLKPSGIDWLGDIPEGWEVKKLRYVGNCQNGISEGSEYFGEGYPFVSYADVYKNIELPLKVVGLAKSSESERENLSVLEGDVFFTRTSETIEEIGIASTCMKTIENAIFSGFLIRFRPGKSKLVKGFSKYFFRNDIIRIFFVKEMNLVTRASLSQELLKRLPILMPPSAEQQRIASYLENESSAIDLAISRITREIDLIREYKTTLIASAVTGGIDVRGWGALPTA